MVADPPSRSPTPAVAPPAGLGHAPSPPVAIVRAVPKGPAASPPKDPAKPEADHACADAPGGGCHIGDLFKLLSQAHMLDLLHTLIRERRPLRFVELQERLGLSPNTLSARLKALTDAGLASRTAYQQIPPRVDYQATDKARDLKHVFGALWEWSQKHDLKPLPIPVAA